MRRSVSADLRDTLAMAAFLLVMLALFSYAAPGFLSGEVFRSMAFQLPELGLLTLAMFMPIISGGLNLAITFIANIAALLVASLLTRYGITDPASVLAIMSLGLLAGLLIGAVIGAIIAYFNAHPILVTLGAMIFLRGLGEFITRGGDISGMPPLFAAIGQGTFLEIPITLWVFITALALWAFIMRFTPLGLSIYMIGSNPIAAAFSGIPVKKVMIALYALSGFMAALAGLIMLARFNSVRIGHGQSYLLVTILACFLAGANPFGGFGRVLPVALALASLQLISSGMNMLGANQHLVTALWGFFLIGVMALQALQRQKP